MLHNIRVLVLVALTVLPSREVLAQDRGQQIYRERCAGCHDQTSARIPPKSALEKMPASRILRVLDFGVMMSVAYPLRRDERDAVSKYLGTSAGDPVPPPSAF